MEENFNPVAQSRANYFTPGSPVQFVCVELLKGDQSGDNAVCLTFKNISRQMVTGLEVQFRCKGASGVLCEDHFSYEGLSAGPGERFGMDDAVFISAEPVTSVEVTLLRVSNGRQAMDLSEVKRVRLPTPKALPAAVRTALEAKMGRQGLKVEPVVLENGWYCACGAFHPNEEDTVYCSECGCDRILLQNTLGPLLQPAAPRPAPVQADEPTRVASSAQPAPRTAPAQDATRTFAPMDDSDMKVEPVRSATQPRPKAPACVADAPTRMIDPVPEAEEEEYDDPRDIIAENLIRWVPALTALVCAAIAMGGFLYCQLAL